MGRLSQGIMVAGPAVGAGAEPVTPDLTPDLDRLLRQEISAVEGGRRTLFVAVIRGEHPTVADKAQHVPDRFILDQNLTPADRKAAAPSAFLELTRPPTPMPPSWPKPPPPRIRIASWSFSGR